MSTEPLTCNQRDTMTEQKKELWLVYPNLCSYSYTVTTCTQQNESDEMRSPCSKNTRSFMWSGLHCRGMLMCTPFGSGEAGCFRKVAALHSDHSRQVPLVGAGCFRQVAALHSGHYRQVHCLHTSRTHPPHPPHTSLYFISNGVP